MKYTKFERVLNWIPLCIALILIMLAVSGCSSLNYWWSNGGYHAGYDPYHHAFYSNGLLWRDD